MLVLILISMFRRESKLTIDDFTQFSGGQFDLCLFSAFWQPSWKLKRSSDSNEFIDLENMRIIDIRIAC